MTGVRCFWLRAALVDFADGRLGEPARTRVERHVSECAHCAESVLALREIPAELALRLRPEPEERFWAEQRRRIATAIERGGVTEVAVRATPRPRPRTAAFWPALPALAAAAGLVALLAREWMPPPTAQISPRPVVSSEESITAFVDEPASIGSVDESSLEDAILAGIDESLEDALAGYSDESLI